MKRKPPDITPAELRIMKVLWRIGSATVREVRDLLSAEAPEPLAYTTVMTMLGQLAAKGAVKVDRARQPFVYSASISREAVLRQRVRQFLETVFDGQAGELVMRLVEEAPLSPEDLRRIEARIGQAEGEPGEGERSGDRRETAP